MALRVYRDGQFNLDPGTFEFWGYGGFFEITMGYGTFTFTQAKAIDVGWDVVVGRGGQALLAWISSSVFARYITTVMQVSPITFNTFKTIFVARDANTAMGVSRLIRDFTRRKGLPSKLATGFMVVTMVFVLIFPTFVSSMSGYSANVQAFVEDESKRDFTHLYYTIHDGDRIGLANETRITSLSRDGEPLLHAGGTCSRYNADLYREECDLLDDITTYVLQYGIESATNNTTSFGRNQTEIEAPSLNITAHYIPMSYIMSLFTMRRSSFNFAERTYGPVLTPSGEKLNIFNESRMLWTAAGEESENTNTTLTYDQEYIDAHGRCQPTKTYKWGFSFIQLFIMVLLLTLWTIGTYILYIRSHIAMFKRNIRTPIAGEYQAVFQLADAMSAQLDNEPESVEKADKRVVGEDELRRRIGKDLKGGRISYKDSLLLQNDDARGERSTWRTRDWIKKEIWWLVLLLLATAGCLLTAWFFPYVVATYMLPLQVLFAMYVGQTGKSRIVLWGWMVVGLSAIPTAVVLGMSVGR